MCRWFAYSGSPVAFDTFLLQPQFSLIDQSLHSRMGVETTNGDGLGIGWYGEHDVPALYRSVSPAWNDRNLRELAAEIQSRMFLAHIRASTGTAIQQTNCHPFRHGRWLWMHNGMIRSFATLRRDLMLAVDPDLFPLIEGSTDSEVMFYLALSMGLTDDPIEAVERMAGYVEKIGQQHSVENPLRMTLAIANGSRLWVVRYSSESDSASLFHTSDVTELRALYPGNPRLNGISEDARLIVSEPLTDFEGVWNEVPEACCVTVDGGNLEHSRFEPRL